MNEMQISFIWHGQRRCAVGQKSDRLSAGEWPNNEMRRGAVFGNRSFSPADVAVGIEFDKLTSGDLGLQHRTFWLRQKTVYPPLSSARMCLYLLSHTK